MTAALASPEKTATPPAAAYELRSYDRSDVAGMIRGMEEDGYIIIKGAIDAAEVAECRRRIDDLKPFGFDRCGTGIDHFKCVFNRSPYWLRFLDQPGTIDAAEGVMGKDCHIIGMTAWRTPPGQGGFGMHVDQLFFPATEEMLLSGAIKLPVMLATAHYYLSDMTIDLCPTWVVPGSHKSGRGPGRKPGQEAQYGFQGGDERSWRGQEAVPVLVKAGDMMLFRSEIWHSGSKNETADRTRYLLQVHYGRRMMAQKFSPYLDFHFNKEVVSQATERQLRILGKHSPSAYD
jgi:ectoine hydroxylase-related dioxygenase (phytanoyl-CoA dioxygenase family)